MKHIKTIILVLLMAFWSSPIFACKNEGHEAPFQFR